MIITVFILCFLFLVLVWDALDALSCLFPGQLMLGWIKPTSGFGCVVQVVCSEEAILELFVKQILFLCRWWKRHHIWSQNMWIWILYALLIVWHWAINLILLCLRVSIYEVRNNSTSCLGLILSVVEGKGGKWE